MCDLIVNRPMLYRVYDDSDDEDRDDFVVTEIRCCTCFFDVIKKIISGKRIITFDFLYQKVFLPKKLKFSKSGNVFFLFSKICVFTCENYKSVFERVCNLDKEKMDKNCLAHFIDYHCVYFLSRETIFFSICDGCRRTLLKKISEKLIKVKYDTI